ncbi:MAG: addiction module toxin RelE [Bacteroidales bacterium 36-12]|nr:MAG: addiction module toxin RelE [Bacteroidales bacterium 36-12]
MNNSFRQIFHTNEFDEFYSSLNDKTKIKFDECFVILESIYVLNTKFIKKLTGTELYEMRVSVGTNEYRTMVFAINHENIIQATEVILLNGFLKKSTKDYDKQIKKATKILEDLT